MPTGNELVKKFVKFVHSHYNLAIADFDDSVDNDLITTDQAIADLKNEAAVPVIIKNLLDTFQEIRLGAQFMLDPFPIVNRIEILDFAADDFKKRNRPFSFSDVQFGYLSSKWLLKFNPISDITTDASGHRTLLDFIAACMYVPEPQLLRNLFTFLEAGNTKRGLLVHKFAHTFSSLPIYSYLFFQKLVQGGKIDLDPTLSYSGAHPTTITFGNLVYQQYFELYDIINEVNHASEIITRFLKVYHMLEYLVYRVELVKIEAKARVNRTFIREIHGLAGKGTSEKEWEIFKKNFPAIFDTEIPAGYFNLGVLSPDQTSFFKNYLSLDPYNPNAGDHVSQLIYRLRNSIVHNKESEFHMTTTNPEDYQDIIPLLNVLIQKLEGKIYEKIATNFVKIRYASNAIELY